MCFLMGNKGTTIVREFEFYRIFGHMKKVLLLMFMSLFAMGCTSDQTLQLEQRFMSEKDLDKCKGQTCPGITISYLKAVAPEGPSAAVNRAVDSTIIRAIDLVEDGITPESVMEAMEQFVDTYLLNLSEFPDMSAVYTAEINIETLWQSDTLLSFSVNQYQYTGGAHGLGRVYFLNFDPVSGQALDRSALIKDLPGFTQVAEQAFRAEHHIEQGASINSTGFWFENDTFSLPPTIGFTQNEVVLVYNPYDIASYAEGSFELRIPIDKIEPYLSLDYL